MDLFGIGTAIKSMANIYCSSARRTGRTTTMVNGLNTGDKVYFNNSMEADRVKALCRVKGVDIETVVLDPKNTQNIFQTSTCKGKVVFDHSWVEDYYQNAIDRCIKDIDHFEKELGGYGGPQEGYRFKLGVSTIM